MAIGLEIFNNQVIEPAQRLIIKGFTEILSFEIPDVQLTVIPNTPLSFQQEQPVAPAPQTLAVEGEKKKSFPELTDEEGSAVAQELIALGEDADPDWFLLDEFEVDYETDDFENAELETAIAHELATSTGTARPNSKSEQDKTIEGKKFYVRYRYDGAIKPNSRPFCKEMIKANKLYRKEDIINMKNSAVNPGWGPNGTDRYSVWEFKGGGLCGHTWNKLLFISAKGFGLDLSKPDVKDKAWSEAEKAGLKIRNNWRVDREPRDMPYKGFLPDNPVWGANGSAYK